MSVCTTVQQVYLMLLIKEWLTLLVIHDCWNDVWITHQWPDSFVFAFNISLSKAEETTYDERSRDIPIMHSCNSLICFPLPAWTIMNPFYTVLECSNISAAVYTHWICLRLLRHIFHSCQGCSPKFYHPVSIKSFSQIFLRFLSFIIYHVLFAQGHMSNQLDALGYNVGNWKCCSMRFTGVYFLFNTLSNL